MSTRKTEILSEVLSMPPEERAELVDNILSSLEPGDPKMAELWAAEPENCVAAFERDEIEPVAAETVFEEIDQQRVP